MLRLLKLLMVVPTVGLVTDFDVARAERRSGDQASSQSLFGDDLLASNLNYVRRRAAELSPEEKYVYLKSWVLPSATHLDFRVIGEFNPANPSPRAIELEPHRFPSKRGGDLVSPVFDLLEVASELQRLDELYAEVASLSDSQQTVDSRAKLVLLILIRLAQEQSEDAAELVTRLRQRLVETFKEPSADYSAELLLLYDAVAEKRELELVGDLLVQFHDNRYELDIADEWRSHLCALLGNYREPLHVQLEGHDREVGRFQHWIPVSRSIAMTRGNGYPATIWHRRSDHSLQLRSGHHRDYLFFASPLAGHYELVGELDPGGRTQMMIGGLFVGPHGGRGSIEVGKFRSEHEVRPVDPPFFRSDPWVRYRAIARDGQLKVFLNERFMVDRELEPGFDPWVAARGIAHSNGVLRHLQVAGEPRILDQVDLSSQAAFTSWYTYYFFTEDAGYPRSLWRWEAGENGLGQIVAKRHSAPRGSWLESILRYHRPLVEDGEIEYEFFYAPDEVHVHPALDRLAFLLKPEGVGLHWCTDGKYDRTLVAPEHVIIEPRSQRGTRPLPLVAGTWNHMKVSLSGQTVSLTLNGRLIFQYLLADSNQRTFGFFRYADRTMSRIRGVTMRGDWPKSLPPLSEQEFADPRLIALEQDIAEPPIRFHHDFARDGLPEQSFKLTGRQLETGITEQSDGVHVELNGVSGWTVAAIMPRIQISGDFDLRTEFELRDLETSWRDGLAFLEVRFDDEEHHYFRAMRGYEPGSGHSVRSQLIRGPLDGHRQTSQERVASWASSGTFRIVRTGNRVTSLFAPGNSSVFRVLGQETIAADALIEDVLLELALKDTNQGHVVWKNLSIRADQAK